ncbi:MAG: AAA family ATPase [Burkholderiaceae bacterium]
MILSASGEVGQVLFESAAGIESLGEIRSTLQAEADARCGHPRHARGRSSSTSEYEQAGIRLNDATVGTSAREAAAADAAQAAKRLSAAQQARREGLQRRHLLERVRRVRPALFALEQAEQALAAQPACVLLPADAAAQLEAVERTRARAQGSLDLLARSMQTRRAELAALVVEDDLLAQAQTLDELAEQARLCRDDPDAIARAEQQVQALQARALVIGEQLGWGARVDDFGPRLPGAAVRDLIARLAESFPVLQTRQDALRDQLAARGAELADLDRRRQALPDPMPVDGLVTALTQAQRLGDPQARRAQLQQAAAAVGRRLSQACDALGRWRLDEQALRRVSLPDIEHLATLLQRRETRVLDRDALATQLRKLDEALARERAQVARFESREQPVGREQVLAARRLRDEQWRGIKQAPARLGELGEAFESALAKADALADQRHDTIRQEADLRNLRDGVAMREAEHQAVAAQSAEAVRLVEQGDAQWAALAGAAGLADLPLALAPGWQQARTRVLELADEAAEATAQLQRLEHQAQGLADALDRGPGAGRVEGRADGHVGHARRTPGGRSSRTGGAAGGTARGDRDARAPRWPRGAGATGGRGTRAMGARPGRRDGVGRAPGAHCRAHWNGWRSWQPLKRRWPTSPTYASHRSISVAGACWPIGKRCSRSDAG